MLSSTGAVIAHEYGALAHRHSERLLTRQKDGTGRERSDCNIQAAAASNTNSVVGNKALKRIDAYRQ